MIVNLARLEETKGSLTANEEVPFEDSFGESRVIDCRIELRYEQSGGAFYFHGELSGVFPTQCHICLEDAVCPVTGAFDVVVRRSGERETGSDDEDGEAEDLITLSLNEHEISFDQHIHENLIVNVPMQVLCTEDCKGLCPRCGVNRNRESCECVTEVDSRWDALWKLKNE